MIVDLDFWAVTVVMNSFEFSESIADEIDIQSPVQQQIEGSLRKRCSGELHSSDILDNDYEIQSHRKFHYSRRNRTVQHS